MANLVRIGGAVLREDAARDYLRALVAGAPDAVTSSTRSWASQANLYDKWIRRVPGYNFALHPSKSDHVAGIAIDIHGTAAKSWFRAHGAAYGWVFTDSREDWHIAWRPNNPQYRRGTVVLPNTPNIPFSPIEPLVPAHIDDEENDHMETLIFLWLKNYGRLPTLTEAMNHLAMVRTGAITWGALDTALAANAEGKAFAALGSESARNAQRQANGGKWYANLIA